MSFFPILMENNLKTATTQPWSSIATPGGGWHTANSILLAARCLEDGDRLLYLCVLSGALHRSVPLQKLNNSESKASESPRSNARVAPPCNRKQQRRPAPRHVLLTMHRETVGLIDDHKVLVLMDNSPAQRLGQHVGVDALQLLREPH